jgi:hypothetical protein
MTKRILTEAEKEAIYDAERSGAAYAKPEPADEPLTQEAEAIINLLLAHEAKRSAQPNAAPADSFTRGLVDGCRIARKVLDDEEQTDTLIEILEDVYGSDDEDREPDPQPFGTLADGTPIMGIFDGIHGEYHRHSIVEAEPESGAWHIIGGADGCFSFGLEGIDGGEGIDLDPIYMPQIRALRDLLNSGAFERIIVAAEAWSRGDAEPPAFADDQPSPACMVQILERLEAHFER